VTQPFYAVCGLMSFGTLWLKFCDFTSFFFGGAFGFPTFAKANFSRAGLISQTRDSGVEKGERLAGRQS